MTISRVPRILLVADHVIIRQRLSLFVREQLPLEVCGECSTATEAVRLVCTLAPDIILLDRSLPGGKIYDFLLLNQQAVDTPQLIALTAQNQPEIARTAAKAGVAGFILKQSGSEALREGFCAALKGDNYFCRLSSARLIRSIQDESVKPRPPLVRGKPMCSA